MNRTHFRIPDIGHADKLTLTTEQMALPEFMVMIIKRDDVRLAEEACPELVAAKAAYDKAWDALVARVTKK